MSVNKRRSAPPGNSPQSLLEAGLRAAGGRIRWGRTLSVAAATLPALTFLSALYVALARFTLLDLARWPVIVPAVAWLIGLGLLWHRQPSRAEAARYLDRRLGLEERIATCVELANRGLLRRDNGPGHAGLVTGALFNDAAVLLSERLHRLPGVRLRLTRANTLAGGAALLALIAALVAPTRVDLLRAERTELNRTLGEQEAQVQALRVEVEGNNRLSPQLRATMLTELTGLESTLRDPSLDQAEGIAVLADAEEKLRSLLHSPSADFNGLVEAAQLMWNSAASNVGWDPELAVSPSDLGKASEATLFMAGNLAGLDPTGERRTSLAAERAASQAAGQDAKLGKALLDTADRVRSRDRDQAAAALTVASQQFALADREREDALALESTLSKLNKGREQVAQVGKPPASKAQVGFRRRSANSNSETGTNGNPPTGQSEDKAAGDQTAGDSTQPSSAKGGTGLGQNAPSYGAAKAGAKGTQGGQNSGAGPSADGQAQPGGSGAPGGQPGNNQGGASVPGQAGGQAGDGQRGTLQGPANGLVGGGAGAISQVANPAGNGSEGASTSRSAPGAESEKVYVPGEAPAGIASEQSGGANSEPPTGAPSQTGAEGRIGEGQGTGKKEIAGRGAGSLAPVRTPYKEVIGQYARQATDALERDYIPPDAKEYVKQYFTALGK